MTKDSAETPSTLSKGKGLSLSWSGLSSQSMQAPSGSNFFSKLKNSTPPFASKQWGGDEIPLKHSGSQTQKPSSADDSLVNTWMKVNIDYSLNIISKLHKLGRLFFNVLWN